jgi:hypothetical protein
MPGHDLPLFHGGFTSPVDPLGVKRKENSMSRISRLTIAAVATAALAGAASSNAMAADPFGQHVSMCAHELGQRADAPAVTCTHHGVTMTFATFGAMVEHMQTMH